MDTTRYAAHACVGWDDAPALTGSIPLDATPPWIPPAPSAEHCEPLDGLAVRELMDFDLFRRFFGR